MSPLILSLEERERHLKESLQDGRRRGRASRCTMDRTELNYHAGNRAEDHFLLVVLVLLSERPVLLNIKERRARNHSKLV